MYALASISLWNAQIQAPSALLSCEPTDGNMDYIIFASKRAA